MAKIRKIYDQTIKPDGSKTTIYPITSIRAVFAPDGSRLDKVLANLHVDLPYIALDSTSDLPPEENHNGYLIGENLYVWVGAGGDTLDGKYQNCGPFKGPRGTVLQPDNEDIRGTEVNTLQLADRNNLEEGMGYVILRKNKTFAEQVTQENTIYEIRYDFDLDGGTASIPSGCILKFEGGSVDNGEIAFDNTILSGTPCIKCDFSGNIGNGYIDVAWFDIHPSSTSQETRFQKIVDLYKSNESSSSWDMHMQNPEPKIIIGNGVYNFGHIDLRSYIHLEGAGRGNTELKNTYFKFSGAYNFYISNLTMTGPENSVDKTIDIDDVVSGATSTGVKDFSEDYSIGIYMVECARFVFYNVCIQKYDIGVCGDEAYSGDIYSNYISYCPIGYLNHGYNTGHAGHNLHFIGGEIANYKYGFVQNWGSSVSIDDSCLEGGDYGVYVINGGHLNVERCYFEANTTADMWGNFRQTRIINNFFGNAHKGTDAYYIYLNETQADEIYGNFFGPKPTNKNHIGVNTIYYIPTINNNFVQGTNPLTVDDGLYVNTSSRTFVASASRLFSIDDCRNAGVANFGLKATFSNNSSRYFRGYDSEKAALPYSVGEWDLGGYASSLDSNCTGIEVFYPYGNRPAWYNGSNWVDAEGYTFHHNIKKSGDATTRASVAAQLTSNDKGFVYFDTSLGTAGKPIWWTGSGWVDATGTAV